jgi:hypothetical protein
MNLIYNSIIRGREKEISRIARIKAKYMYSRPLSLAKLGLLMTARPIPAPALPRGCRPCCRAAAAPPRVGFPELTCARRSLPSARVGSRGVGHVGMRSPHAACRRPGQAPPRLRFGMALARQHAEEPVYLETVFTFHGILTMASFQFIHR